MGALIYRYVSTLLEILDVTVQWFSLYVATLLPFQPFLRF